MKTAQQMEKFLPERCRRMLVFDKREMDNPDLYDHARLNYLDRLQKIMRLITKRFRNPKGVAVADIGCGQGNLSLLLAEKGFEVTGVDIDPVYLEYAGYKHERGSVKWLQGSFDQLNFGAQFEVIVLGELVEHCAYPEDFIQKALSCLKTNGILIITTPNASMFRNKLPTFSQLQRREDRAALEQRQFGPDGADHLFLFTLSDLRKIIPKEMMVDETGYLGGTVLINRRTTFLLRLLPEKNARRLERLAAMLPGINHYTCHGIYAVVRKD